jgi:cytochrome c-type biogenesis protein CcmH
MHADIQALVAGGYSANEILDAFIATYGERVLMAPRARGFNWSGYVTPFVAVAAGAAVVTFLLRRWTRASAATAAAPAARAADIASPEELDRLAAAVRNDEDDS